jgi:GTP pyrophosphokinase
LDKTAFTEKLRHFDPADRERILDALTLAEEEAPGDLSRALGAAGVLLELKPDADTLCALFLRRSFVKDPRSRRGNETAETLARRFGPEAAALAEDAAGAAVLFEKGTDDQAGDPPGAGEAERIRRMILALVRDIRSILIGLAEKLYALRNSGAEAPDTETEALNTETETEALNTETEAEARKAAARNGLAIYAPLADRLGVSWIKDEMEDLCLKELHRDAYVQIKELVALKRGERSAFLHRAAALVTAEAASAGIAVEVQSRAKHFYSIYRKMRKRGKAPGDIYDLFGLRLLCEAGQADGPAGGPENAPNGANSGDGGVDLCYTLLGLVHRLWKPVPGRFKDYIARPKPNGYRSLHTSVVVSAPADEDEDHAEDDPAGNTVLEIQIRTGEMHRTAEYGVASHWLYKRGTGIGKTRDGFAKNALYVFTPRGKVLELPPGATPLDFAFHIHSSVGEHCQMARADGAIIPLSAELKNAQVVEILTSPAAHPTGDWLRFVKSPRTRSKIRSWLQRHDEHFAKEHFAKEYLAKEPLTKKEEPKNQKSPEEKPGAGERRLVVEHRGIFKVKVEDEKNMLFRFARCCNPILGDPITGYVSRGRGIIIHREDCRGLRHIPDFQERRVEARWEKTGETVKRFSVEAKYRENLFSEIEGAVRKYQGHLIEGRLDETENGGLTGHFAMRLENREDARKILRQLRGIPAVSSIRGL